MSSKKNQTLYERLGGLYSIAALVDDFRNHLFANPVINSNPRVKQAHEHIPVAGIKYQLTSFICQAAGGPQRYVGRSHYEAHSYLKISEKEWQALIDEFQRSMEKFAIGPTEQKELLDLIDSTKKEVISSQAK